MCVAPVVEEVAIVAATGVAVTAGGAAALRRRSATGVEARIAPKRCAQWVAQVTLAHTTATTAIGGRCAVELLYDQRGAPRSATENLAGNSRAPPCCVSRSARAVGPTV